MCDLQISIIIPVFNGEQTLANCIDALFSQKYIENESYEIIVVNDGSTDDSAIIADRYPVNLISLPTNSGRIVAREAGAKAAKSEKLLFIDCRVIASPTLVSIAANYNKKICYAGDLGENEGNNSEYDRLFFLLRNKYYFPYYPQTKTLIELTKDNFFKMPKGTTCILIPKGDFLNAIPKSKGKEVNDDTRLFYYLIYETKNEVYRSLDLKVTYLQRGKGDNFNKWLIERGIRFTNFYIRKKPIFFVFLAFLIMSIVIGFLKYKVAFLYLFIGLMLFLYISGVIFLCKKKTDFFLILKLFYKMLFIFSIGVLRGLFCLFGTYIRKIR